jgi:phosphoglycolate phosphatase
LHTHVEHHGLTHYFDRVYGLKDHYARSKVERGRELIFDSQIDREHTLLIGDTDHDLEVAQELGIEALLIADGHQSFERLEPRHHRVLKSRHF